MSKHIIVYECGLGHGPGDSYCAGEGHNDGQAYVVVPIGYITGTGQLLFTVHSPDSCEGEGCAIHHPSNHSMKDFPTHWRSKTELYEIGLPLMERICSHGIGHPDPDHLAWVKRVRGAKSAAGDAVHGCDGCCGGATIGHKEGD